jgi:hypothetical protein
MYGTGGYIWELGPVLRIQLLKIQQRSEIEDLHPERSLAPAQWQFKMNRKILTNPPPIGAGGESSLSIEISDISILVSDISI